ncbi:MAG TPA: threonine/serine exporter [Epulopiscium sp.]|nr:threonine/serine exporter [Candidatus Epulonipiscium sp.]
MIIGTISAFIATVGFSIFFHVPKKELLFCGAIGALGWLVYLLCIDFGLSPIIANFVAALIISQGSSTLAKARKLPVTILLIPGIIPVVPGAATYQTMHALLIGNYVEALGYASYTFQVAAAIAGAIVLTTMLPRILGTVHK